MFNFINQDKKTALIIPTKYHNELRHKLLHEYDILFNVSLISIDSFCSEILQLNSYPNITREALNTKLDIHQKLVDNKHQYAYNANYIDELFKLEKEVVLSNINYQDDIIINNKIDIKELKCLYDEVYILSYEDFYPLYHDIINKINTTTIKLEETKKHSLYEHDNIIQMLDYIIYDIYQNSNEETLVIVDDSIQKTYITKQLDILGIPYNSEQAVSTINTNIIKALFNVINEQANKYDYQLLNKKYINIDSLNQLILINNQKEYLERLYDLLYETKIFDSNKLNKLFTTLYLRKDTNIKILNNYILDELLSLLSLNEIINAQVMIASSSYNSLKYNRVYVVDASLKGLSSNKTSFLLNQKHRNEIDDKFIDNGFYNTMLKEAQQRIINCGNHIDFHYCLNSIDNKPQELAFFINDLNLKIEDKKPFFLLTNHHKKENTILKTNNIQLNNVDIINDKFNGKLNLSSTSMDSFYACPYRYFVNYILKPRVKLPFSYLDLGSIYHKVLEIVNNHIIESKIKYHQLEDNYLNKVILDACQEYDLDSIIVKRINHNILELIKHLSIHEAYSSYEVFASEQRLSYEYNGINIVGNIDLIMKCEDYYYIVDYKSSTKKFNENEFNAGISNQLIIYLSLLKNQNYNLTGAFYKAIQTKYIKTKEILNEDAINKDYENTHKLEGIYIDSRMRNKFDSSFETISTIANVKEKSGKSKSTIFQIDEILSYFETLNNNMNQMKENIEKASFNILPYDSNTCTYCDYKNICKVGPTPLTRKELETND